MPLRPPSFTLFPYTTLFRSESTPAFSMIRVSSSVTPASRPVDPHTLHQKPMVLGGGPRDYMVRSEEHTSELQSLRHLVCRLLLEKNKLNRNSMHHLAAPPIK